MPSGEVSRALSAGQDSVATQLLAVAEDQWFERKSVRIEPRRLAEALVGFANADGGVLAVGLYNGSVEGTRHHPRHRNELMQTAINLTEPTVQAKSALYACTNSRGEPDDILVFEIPPSSTVHATTRDEVYLRVGDETRRLTFAQRRELTYDKGQAAFEAESSALTVADIDTELLENYAGQIGHPDAQRLLRPVD